MLLLYKSCPRCGKRIEVGTKCNCQNKRYKEEDKYKRESREKKFYSSVAWQRVRARAINRYNGLDIYSYYIFQRIEIGQTVHHIIPVKECWAKRFDVNNLIYLTEENHQRIHKLMRESDSDKVKTMLKTLIVKFCLEFGKK